MKNEPESNYEDLFYLSQQIADEEDGEIFNPAVFSFVSEIRDKFQKFMITIPYTEEKTTLSKIARRSCVFIECVIRDKLSYNKSPIGLDLISDMAKSEIFNTIDIVTLNHDLLIERQLNEKHVQYIDGFGDPDGDIKHFDPELFEKICMVRLFKLHGSIDWYVFRDDTKPPEILYMGKPDKNSPNRPFKNSSGGNVFPDSGNPIILAGTYNKIMDYNFGIFYQLIYRFRKSLREKNIMIMSGYGWNDKGINHIIKEWIQTPSEKCLYL